MERGAEICAVDRVVPRRFRVVNVFAFGAVESHVAGVGHVVLAHGQQVLRLADDARALAEDALLELVELRAGWC